MNPNCLFFITAGLFSVLSVLLFLLGERKSRSFSKTTGRVTGACDNAASPEGSFSFLRIGGGADNACLIFEYRAEGRTFRRTGMIAWNRSHVMHLTGKTIAVYYPPDQPALGRTTRWTLFHAGGLIAFFAASLLAVVHFFS